METHEFEAADNGRRVRIAMGEQFALVLSENPTSGFRWSVICSGEPACRLTSDAFAAAEPARPGGAGRHRWSFEAIAPGEAEIQLAYVRKWEQKPGESFSLSIEVHRP